jgi:hypothetical protein
MQCLKDVGYDVKRDPNSERTDFDILIRTTEGWMVIEVKERNEAFTSPDDFPYPTVFVDRKGAFDKKAVRPMAVVTVSLQTGAIIFVGVTPQTFRHRFRTTNSRNHSGRQQTNYEVGTQWYQSASQFRRYFDSFTHCCRRRRRYVVADVAM